MSDKGITDKNLEIKDQQLLWMQERLIFLTYTGSIAYGTQQPDSDEDLLGIVVPPPEYMLGLKIFGHHTWKDPDCTFWNAKDFVSKLFIGSPVHVEALHTDPASHLYVHPLAKLLIERRDLCVTNNAAKNFGKFAATSNARAQLSRGKGEGDLSAVGERKRQRILKYGWDTKEQMHSFRLMTMALEMINGKGVKVMRQPEEVLELLSVLDGEWDIEDYGRWFAKQEAEFLRLESYSRLPKHANIDQLSILCQSILEASYSYKVKVPSMNWQFAEFQYGSGSVETKPLTANIFTDENGDKVLVEQEKK